MRQLPASAWKPGPDVKGFNGENLARYIFPYEPSPVIGKVTHAGSAIRKTFLSRHRDDFVAFLTLALTIGIPTAAGVPLRDVISGSVITAALLWLLFHFCARPVDVTFLGENGAQFVLRKRCDDVVDFRSMAHLSYIPGTRLSPFELQWYDMEGAPGPCWDRMFMMGMDEIQRGWGRHLSNRLADDLHAASMRFNAVAKDDTYIVLSSSTLAHHAPGKELVCQLDALKLNADTIVMGVSDGRRNTFTMELRDFVDGYAIMELVRRFEINRSSAASVR
jgi:hypothetical protein